MKRELFIHFCFWFSYFVLITLVTKIFRIDGWFMFWIGGLIGLIIPDIDHLIYVYFIKPADLSSQRFIHSIKSMQFKRGVMLLYETRQERKELVFHSIVFQLIFFVLVFWVMSSSNSFFGRGVALSFLLHLSVDQLIDYMDSGNLENWFNNLPLRLSEEQSKYYWIITMVLVFLMGFLI